MNKPHPDFDLTFRPDYWAPSDPISLIIANVKGEERRRLIMDVLEQRHHLTPPGTDLPAELLQDTLSNDDRTAWGKLRPTFIGGEYLPDYARGEIEIARIVVATEYLEVVSVRACRTRDLRIHYRVVDEYQTAYAFRPRSSKAPLTVAELISLIDALRVEGAQMGHEFVTWCRDVAYSRGANDPARCAHLVTVKSAFYKQLEAYYRWRNERWLANELAALAAKGGDARSSRQPSSAGEEAAR